MHVLPVCAYAAVTHLRALLQSVSVFVVRLSAPVFALQGGAAQRDRSPSMESQAAANAMLALCDMKRFGQPQGAL